MSTDAGFRLSADETRNLREIARGDDPRKLRPSWTM
jgi:hypothetical protein